MSETKYWKLILLGVLFFALTPLTLAISFFTLLNMNSRKDNLALADAPRPGVQLYASLPNEIPQVIAQPGMADARVEIIKQYLESYKSPLAAYSKTIVETADKYNLDFRLITAIAQQESNLCKFIPPESHNCWGWGIHSRGTLGFSSYEEAIETVSQGLREKYLDKGYLSVDEIMSKYTPSSPGTWARGVNIFMADME